MWKYIPEGLAGFVPDRLTLPPMADWPWRRILAEGAILAGFLFTSSILIYR